MATADLNHPLMKIAHPGIYERNPFNVLNLPVDATAKEIRRRREDIEAAFASGTEAEEFRDVLPVDEGRKTATLEEVAELFKQLEDPQTRIAYALFWFWPESIGDAGVGGKRRGTANPNAAFCQPDVIAGWEKEAQQTARSAEGLVARHNLAVFHHMMGLAYELALEKYDKKEVETPDYVHTYWKTATHWWNDIGDEPELLCHVSNLVSALGDPRVDDLFARSLCDQFASAFGQINAELAIDFAKTGRDADARRQVEYIRLSQLYAEDVDEVLENAFASFFRQVEAIIKTANDEIRQNPKAGLRLANFILSQTDAPLRIVRVVLGEGNTICQTLFSLAFTGVRNCMIAYGNKTQRWANCLAMMPWLKELALTEEQKRQIEQDEKTLVENKQDKELQENCWFCKKNKADEDCSKIEMYGEVSYDRRTDRVSWRKGKIRIPRCKECERRLQTIKQKSIECHQTLEEQKEKRSRAWVAAGIALFLSGIFVLGVGDAVDGPLCARLSVLGGVIFIICVLLAKMWGANVRKARNEKERVEKEYDAMRHEYATVKKSCPQYIQLLALGWKEGSEPSTWEVHEVFCKWVARNNKPLKKDPLSVDTLGLLRFRDELEDLKSQSWYDRNINRKM